MRFHTVRRPERLQTARAGKPRRRPELNGQITAYQQRELKHSKGQACCLAKAALTAEAGTDAGAAQHGGTIAAIRKLKHERVENTLPEQTEQAAARGFDSSC